jgi:hypothetical protein
MLAGLLALAPSVAHAQVDQTCALMLTRFDPATLNVLYPDDSAQYWTGAYAAAPGTRLRIDGRFPHARYMSFNVYDAQLRPTDAVADLDIVPDPGSANPYRAGADRTAPAREYTVFVEFAERPPAPAPNTIYTGAEPGGLLTYRIYIPDTGRDELGDAGLPAVTVQAADGGKAPPSACAQASKPSVAGINETLRDSGGVPATENSGVPGRNPPVWRKFTNLLGAFADNVTDAEMSAPLFELQRGLGLHELGGNGGFLSNLHNAYVSAFTNRAFGRVLVTRMRPPTFPDTRGGAPVMGAGQLRYWSLCGNDPPTQRFVACLNDDRVVTGADGLATFVMTTTGERPPNAKPECGLNWLPWGNGARNVLIYRHMLPEAGFAQAIQRAAFEQEGATMVGYLPVSEYRDAAGAQALGCPGPPALVRAAAPARCRVLLRLPRRARRAVVHVDGRRVMVLRGKRLRRPVRVHGTRVRAVVTLRDGRRTVVRRTLRGCG